MLSQVPKRIYSIEEVKSGERLYEVCIVLRDTQGSITKSFKIFEDANVNIKTGSIFYVPDKKKIRALTFFIDISNATLKIEDIEKKLFDSGEVLNVKFVQPRPAPFEVIHFPVLQGNSRAIILGRNTFATLLNGFEEILTTSGLEAVLYNVGKKIGVSTSMKLKDRYCLEDKDLIPSLIQRARALGWGIVKFKNIDFNTHSGEVIIRESFEALSRRNKQKKTCHWTRGYFAGCMSVVFGYPVDAIEKECIAAGGEHCIFVIQRNLSENM